MNPRGENKLSDAKRGRVMLDYFISKYSLDEKTIRNRFWKNKKSLSDYQDCIEFEKNRK